MLAEDKGIRLKTQVPAHCGFRGDTRMLQRLISNLLDNAIRYTPAGGEVGISMEEKETEICISVKDTGPGISPEHLPHIFKRFYRADPSRSQQVTGLVSASPVLSLKPTAGRFLWKVRWEEGVFSG